MRSRKPRGDDTVTAYVGTGSLITGNSDDNITAALTTDFASVSVTKSAGSSVGVGASISVAVLEVRYASMLQSPIVESLPSPVMREVKQIEASEASEAA